MSIFQNAKSAPKATKGAKVSDAERINVEGVEALSALKAVAANVAAMIQIEEQKVKGFALNHFVVQGMKMQRQPANFIGVDNGSEASMQLKSRSSASALSEDEQKLLADAKIPMGEKVAKDETFIINPEYADNQEMLEKVSEALEDLNLPADFILRQEKEATKIATKDSINAVFKIKDAVMVEALLPIVTTQAVRASLAEGVDPFEIVEAIMGEKNAEAKDQAHD